MRRRLQAGGGGDSGGGGGNNGGNSNLQTSSCSLCTFGNHLCHTLESAKGPPRFEDYPGHTCSAEGCFADYNTAFNNWKSGKTADGSPFPQNPNGCSY